MSEVLVLPDPQQTSLARLPETLRQSALIRVRCQETGDVATAQELKRRLDAMTRYISDKKARKDLQGETRLVEVLIGKLLGPINPGARTDLSHDERGGNGAIDKSDKVRFRALADNEETVEQLVSEGVTERAKILKQIARNEMSASMPVVAGETSIRHGDFREVLADVPDGSVDLIFTDPPYAKEFVPVYEDLAAFSARVLRPGGSLLAYCGQYALPQILSDMQKHLRYWWMCACVHHGGNHKSLPGIKTYVLWKPIVWFVKETNGSDEFVYDAILRPAPDKKAHDWQQALDEPLHYIEKLSTAEGLVVDPFAGGGTTLVAAQQLGRRFLGAELDAENCKIALGRLAA